MNKEKLLKLIEKKEARKKELGEQILTSEDVKELRSINAEINALNDEITELRGIINSIPDEDDNTDDEDLESRAAQPVGVQQVMGSFGLNAFQRALESDKKQTEELEQRGKDLKSGKAVAYDLDEIQELRSVSIGSGQLLTEKKYSRTMNDTFNEVSGLIDRVNAVPINGGESYSKAFMVEGSEGAVTGEGADYHESDPKTDYVETGKVKVTVYIEMTEEAEKLPNVNYQAMVKKEVVKATRKKITKMMVSGAGGANAITGVFNAPAKVIPANYILGISEIGPDTLDNIVFGFGGDEDVEGTGLLILAKEDLAAFAAVRDNTGKKLYKIKTSGNSGTISSDGSYNVNYVINSQCPALSKETTAIDTKCMAYGYPSTYEFPIFSKLDVKKSSDYKFKSGQTAYRASIFVGGTPAAYKGFLPIKKKAAAEE